ncbi:hypothetical protein L9F63_026172, partial [Diploptera punctata]
MKNSVYTNDTLCKILGLNKRVPSKKYTDQLITEIAKTGISLVAVEVETEKVVGVSINLLQ